MSDKDKTIMDLDLHYRLEEKSGKLIAGGEARARLGDSSFSITPRVGSPLSIQYIEVIGITEGDYRITLITSSAHKLTLTQLGFDYENFLTNLYKARNELFVKYLLMNERVRVSQIESSMIYYSQGAEIMQGPCELRLYDSALVVLPQKSRNVRIPYCYISSYREEDYAIVVESELSEKLVFSQMGEKRDYLMRSLSEAIDELSSRTTSLLEEVMPGLSFQDVARLSNMLREGKAAQKAQIDGVVGGLWPLLEAKARLMGLEESYDYLKGMAQSERISIGIKRGFSRDAGKDYVWFLIPVYEVGASAGNAVALEATTGDDEGRATYFFRIVCRESYRRANDLQSLHKEFDIFLKTINRCMVEINFRREPIYFSEQQLNDPRYSNYRYAVQEMPYLQTLRSLFIGRVAHFSPEQWKADVEALLRFNVEQESDESKWVK